MFTLEEKSYFLENGYLIVENILRGDHLTTIQNAFEKVWQKEEAEDLVSPSHSLPALLKYRAFQELIEFPAILERH